MAKKPDGRPRHQQIAADLRALIMAGDLSPGTQLPSTQHLVDRYGSSNATIQRALRALKDEGFVSSRAGAGVYVRSRQPFIVDVANYFAPSPGGYSYDMLDVDEVRPPADVAQVFDLSEDGVAILRHRMLRHNGDPLELNWSYYPIAIARGTALEGTAKIRGGAPRVLAEAGYPQRDFADRLSARMPTMGESEALGLPADVPVIRQFRVIYSDDNVPVEVSVLVKGGHLYELRYRQPVH